MAKIARKTQPSLAAQSRGHKSPAVGQSLALAPESQVCTVLSRVLAAIGGDVDQIVVGHTITHHAGFPAGTIGSRCAGKVLLVDVGMSNAWLRHGLIFDSAAQLFSRNA